MTSSSAGTISRLLAEIEGGSAKAKEELFAKVHDELRHLAHGLMRHERAGHTLDSTALVHEACIRLLEGHALEKARNRSYFFGAAARAMRQILVDHARQRAADKRGGGRSRIPLDDVLDGVENQLQLDVLALNDALEKLADQSPRQVEVTMLRFFGGLEVKEIAEILELSISTVEQDWRMARAWLHRELAPK